MIDLLTANDPAEGYPRSWYAATATDVPPHPPLLGTLDADVCVVGAGYTGLSAALHLAKAGFRVVVLDAHGPGWGASGRNGGQVGSGQRRDQAWLERAYGTERAQALWDMAEDAKSLVRRLVGEHKIACDLRDGIVYAAHKRHYVAEYHAQALHDERTYGYEALRSLDAAQIRTLLGTEAYFGGVLDSGAAHLHPLKYAFGLARAAVAAGALLHGKSRVLAVEPGTPARVRTEAGEVRARYVVLACNGYGGGLFPEVGARVMPINNFIVATEPLGRERAESLIRDRLAVADSRFVVNYYRLSADDRLIFGGGETYGYRFPKDITALVRPRLESVYPQLRGVRINYSWGGTLAITANRVPAFQRPAPMVLSAAGYSGHGVALATLAGETVANAIRGTAERFDLIAEIAPPRFPGGGVLRAPLLALAMSWYALRDRL